MKKILISTLLATSLAFTQNAFAAKCDVKKIGYVDERENLVGLSYNKFKVSYGNIDGDDGFYENIFFKFNSPNENLTPKYMSAKLIKKDCLESADYSSVHDIPIFYSASANALVIESEFYFRANGAAGDVGGFSYKIINTKTGKEFSADELYGSFKDKNFAENPKLLQVIGNRLKEQHPELEGINYDGLIFPDNSLGIEKGNKYIGGNIFIGTFSKYSISGGADGIIDVRLYPQDLNPFLKENSILYKLLNDK